MAIITLTSDFGLSDYYVGVIKGAILCQNPNLNIVDISHNIKTYDIVQASFIIKNTYRAFPKGTIHVVSVNNFINTKKSFIAIQHKDHYFIGPDNGLFSLVFEDKPTTVYRLNDTDDYQYFPLKDIFANAIGHITSDKPFEEIGQKVLQIQERITLQPVVSKSQIRGSVIHIDNYENVIVNIPQVLFEQVAVGRKFELFFKRYDPITSICTHYSDVPVGETLCLFNSTGYLEISVNLGKAASLHNLKIDDTIQIDFF
ncbi:MAG: S-adenosyl-l-methionine hydroxide adenosyltransferase family protein [Saprospiraceae bacterium]